MHALSTHTINSEMLFHGLFWLIDWVPSQMKALLQGNHMHITDSVPSNSSSICLYCFAVLAIPFFVSLCHCYCAQLIRQDYRTILVSMIYRIFGLQYWSRSQPHTSSSLIIIYYYSSQMPHKVSSVLSLVNITIITNVRYFHDFIRYPRLKRINELFIAKIG